MKAIIKTRYGGPEVLQLAEVEEPVLKQGHLLIKVEANSVNPADWHILRGKPFFSRFTLGLFQPKEKILGADFAGTVVKTGSKDSRFKVGDQVFGETLTGGAFAEYTCVPETVCAHMPVETLFPEMASVPVAGLTALQALVTHGQLKKGETVLINGASGGVGHFAVQIAKAVGARVTAVCSSNNTDFVKFLGADQVIAYDKENIHRHEGKYNLVVDTNGNLTYQDYTRMGERGVMVGFTTMRHLLALVFNKAVSRFPLAQFTAQANRKDLETLALLVEQGQVHVHLEKIYPYKEVPAAIHHIEGMRTKGKVAIVWKENPEASYSTEPSSN